MQINARDLFTVCIVAVLTFMPMQWASASNDERPTYQVSVSSISSTMGSVGGSGTYDSASVAIITATPNHGYRFISWHDLSQANPRSVTVNSDLEYVAYFDLDSFNIRATNRDTNQGHVWGSGRFQYQAYATLRATPTRGYRFVQWHDGDTNNPRRVRVEDDATYNAFFMANSYRVRLNSANDVMGSTQGTGEYFYHDTATLTAIPAQGYRFVRWNDGDTTNPRRLLVPDEDVSFTSYFGLEGYHISVRSNNNSEGSVAGDSVYIYGATATIEATPAEGYHFVRWNDGVTAATRTFTVTSDSTFVAYFFINSYSVTARTVNAVMGTVAGSGTYEYSTQVTLTATPATGFHFTQWNDGNTENPRVFSATQSGVYTAYFDRNEYYVNVASADNMRGSVARSQTAKYGDEVVLTATPYRNYRFTMWSNGITDNPYRMVVSSDTTLLAIFDTIVSPAGICDASLERITFVLTNNHLNVTNAASHHLTISDLGGRVILSTRIADDNFTTTIPQRGIYVVTVDGRLSRRFMVY